VSPAQGGCGECWAVPPHLRRNTRLGDALDTKVTFLADAEDEGLGQNHGSTQPKRKGEVKCWRTLS